MNKLGHNDKIYPFPEISQLEQINCKSNEENYADVFISSFKYFRAVNMALFKYQRYIIFLQTLLRISLAQFLF